jgi:nucleotidyltransferase substrate binding protein (TIGR01987 family)
MKKSEQNKMNLERALNSLILSVATPPIAELDYAGIIKSFETAYELTWKTLKAILEENGIPAPFPRIAFEEGFRRNLIEGNEIWKDIMDAKNQSVHTYDKDMAIDLCKRIKDSYVPILQKTFAKIVAV